MSNVSAKFIGKLGLAAMALSFSGCDKDHPGGGGVVEPKPTERTTISAITSTIGGIILNTNNKTLAVDGGYGDNKFNTVYSYDPEMAKQPGAVTVRIQFDGAGLKSLTPSTNAYTGEYENYENVTMQVKSATSNMVAYSTDGMKQTPEILNRKAMNTPLLYGKEDKEEMMRTWNSIIENKSTIIFTEVTQSKDFVLKYGGSNFSMKAPQ